MCDNCAWRANNNAHWPRKSKDILGKAQNRSDLVAVMTPSGLDRAYWFLGFKEWRDRLGNQVTVTFWAYDCEDALEVHKVLDYPYDD